MSFTLTPHGALAHLPLVTIRGRVYADLSWSTSEVSYAHSASRWRREGIARTLLILRPYSHNTDRSRPSYTVGYLYSGDSHRRLVAPPGDILRRRGKTQWKDIYLIHVPEGATTDSPDPLIDIPFNRDFSPPFRFPPENVQSFANSLRALPVSHPAVHMLAKHTRRPWRAPATFTFSRPESIHHPPIVIAVGCCPYGGGSLWANACALDHLDSEPPADTRVQRFQRALDHACPDDHVSEWTGLGLASTVSETFEVYRRELWHGVLSRYRTVAVTVTLSFGPCRLGPRTLVLHASANAMPLRPQQGRARGAKMEDQDPYPTVDM